jgi:exonuclease III
MQVLSWNVQGAFPPQGSPERIATQVEYIQEAADCPDLLLLNEVTTDRRERWHEKLRDSAGYTEIVDTLDWSRELGKIDVQPFQDFNGVNGNLIAVHEESDLQDLERRSASIEEPPFGDAALKHWDTNFPEKILNAEVVLDGTTIDLWNIRTVPGSMFGEEKIKILENTFHRILAAGEKPRILAGDFNAPKDETADGEVVPWREDDPTDLGERWRAAERNILTGLDEVGMIDVFRSVHGYGELDVLDISHPTTDDDSIVGKRFDHLLASRTVNPQTCVYDAKGLECSDHAPLIAEFSPQLST